MEAMRRLPVVAPHLHKDAGLPGIIAKHKTHLRRGPQHTARCRGALVRTAACAVLVYTFSRFWLTSETTYIAWSASSRNLRPTWPGLRPAAERPCPGSPAHHTTPHHIPLEAPGWPWPLSHTTGLAHAANQMIHIHRRHRNSDGCSSTPERVLPHLACHDHSPTPRLLENLPSS